MYTTDVHYQCTDVQYHCKNVNNSCTLAAQMYNVHYHCPDVHYCSTDVHCHYTNVLISDQEKGNTKNILPVSYLLLLGCLHGLHGLIHFSKSLSQRNSK